MSETFDLRLGIRGRRPKVVKSRESMSMVNGVSYAGTRCLYTSTEFGSLVVEDLVAMTGTEKFPAYLLLVFSAAISLACSFFSWRKELIHLSISELKTSEVVITALPPAT